MSGVLKGTGVRGESDLTQVTLRGTDCHDAIIYALAPLQVCDAHTEHGSNQAQTACDSTLSTCMGICVHVCVCVCACVCVCVCRLCTWRGVQTQLW